MKSSAHRARVGVVLAGMALFSLPARADDWLQFRKDERHSGASRDRVALPLTELWRLPGGSMPVVRRGRVYFVQRAGSRRSLVCADECTGTIRWRQPLAEHEGALRFLYDTEPAVTESGVVLIYDYVTGWVGTGFGQRPPDGFYLRSFDGLSGRPLAALLPSGRAEETGSRLVVSDGAGGDRVDSTKAGIVGLGPPLVSGNAVFAASFDDGLMYWSAAGKPSYFRLAHKLPGGPEAMLPASLDLYPPVAAAGGVLVSGYWKQQTGLIAGPTPNPQYFLALLSGGRVLWHRETPGVPGVAAADLNLVFVPMSTGGITAIDGAGNPRWVAPGFRQAAPTSGGFVIDPARVKVRSQLVTAQGKVYGYANGGLSSLDQLTGKPTWPQPQKEVSGWSQAASPEHLFVGGGKVLWAVRREDGEVAWRHVAPDEGSLALADGLLYHAGRKLLSAYAPAERTFRVAIDSPHLAEYQREAPPEAAPESPPAVTAPQPDSKTPPEAANETKGIMPRGDASILRLKWNDGVPELIRKARERRGQVPGVPLALTLDWLDASRSRLLLSGAPVSWTPEATEAFSQACAALAAEVHPEHFDVAPDLNVYLSRRPGELEAVRALLRRVREKVHGSSPETKVLVSLNVDVLLNRYGDGAAWPFGPWERPKRPDLKPLLALMEELEEVGLSAAPQSSFKDPQAMPGDYLLSVRALLGERPLLITGLSVRRDAGLGHPGLFLQRLLAQCYWLKARVVALPEVQGAPAEAPLVPQGSQAARAEPDLTREAVLGPWREVVAWKRVPELTARPAYLGQ